MQKRINANETVRGNRALLAAVYAEFTYLIVKDA